MRADLLKSCVGIVRRILSSRIRFVVLHDQVFLVLDLKKNRSAFLFQCNINVAHYFSILKTSAREAFHAKVTVFDFKSRFNRV